MFFQSAKAKDKSKHLKQFNEGIDLYFHGLQCPIENTAVKDGWVCAESMIQAKNQALSASRQRFNVA